MPNSFRRDYPVTWSILLFVLGCKDKNSKIQNEIFWREHGALWECDPRWNTEIMNANVLSESSKAFIGARRHYRDKTTATHSYPHPREIPLSPSCPHLLTVTPFCSVPTGWEADVSVWSWILVRLLLPEAARDVLPRADCAECPGEAARLWGSDRKQSGRGGDMH